MTTPTTLRVIHAETRKTVATNCLSESEAKTVACAAVKSHLAKSKAGRRVLDNCDGVVTWDMAKKYCLIQPETNVWKATNGGKIVPEGIEHDERAFPILFATDSGEEHRGTYDMTIDMFISAIGRRYAPAKVTAFLIVPPLYI